MRILICSIIRDEARHMDRWYAQIKRTIQSMPQHEFTLSVYENDSTDGSASKLASFDWSFLLSYVTVSAKLNCPFFIGGKHPLRTEILAYVRNQCMRGSPFLQHVERVLWIEPDIEYSSGTMTAIIDHEKIYGIKTDVFTGKSVHPGSENIYDSWGTRKIDNQTDWRDEDGQTAGLEKMWSVWNCLVSYNAEPIKRGIGFSGVNPRTGQPDCDTVAICEAFRASGYDQIYWNTDLHVTHFTS